MGEASPAGPGSVHTLSPVAVEVEQAASSVSVQQLSQGVSITLLRVMVSDTLQQLVRWSVTLLYNYMKIYLLRRVCIKNYFCIF